MVLEAYIRWTNDLAFLEKLWPNAEAAARWLTDYGDQDGDTFIEFHCTSEKGLVNQGWKDSFDLATHSDGRTARSPMALCEVQGYTYAAYRAMSYLASRLGKHDCAVHWDHVQRHYKELFVALLVGARAVFVWDWLNTKNLVISLLPMQDNAYGRELSPMIWLTRSPIA